MEASLTTASSMLERLGHVVEGGAFPAPVAEAMSGDGWALLWMMDVAIAIDERVLELGRDPEPCELEPLGRWIYEHAKRSSARDYVAAQRSAHRAATAMAEAFAEFDVILTPSTATLPPPVGAFGAASENFRYEAWSTAAYGFAPFTELFNVTGQPAVSLPISVSRTGLPIGTQLVGQPLRDGVLLQLAASIERAVDWAHRHPPGWAGMAVR